MPPPTRQPDLFAAHTPAPDPLADQIARAPGIVRARLAVMRTEPARPANSVQRK